MALQLNAGVNAQCHPEDNDSMWWDLGCLRKCNGTLDKSCFTTKECEGCGRDYHCVCLAKMKWPLDGEKCMIDGAWYCKNCFDMYQEGYKNAKEDADLVSWSATWSRGRSSSSCARSARRSTTTWCATSLAASAVASRLTRPTTWGSTSRAARSGNYNSFCRVAGCTRDKGFAKATRRDAHEKTCRTRMANHQFSTAMQNLLPAESQLTDVLGLDSVPAITTASDTAAPAAV